MKKSFVFLMAFVCGITSAHANWQYSSRYQRDVWGGDDGMRFVLSVRGGAAYGKANIQNDIGGLTTNYMINSSTGEIVTYAWWNAVGTPNGYSYAGYGQLGTLPAANDYKELSFTAGFSAGLTVPDTPQWRIEFGFDHIAEAEYNENPLFEGTLALSSGYSVDAQSGAVQSKLSTDIYSIMLFYDMFQGVIKPIKTFIPYIGFGAGYADSKTVLQLTDSYGDLSDIYELVNFGVLDDANVIQFNKSETNTSNLVPMAAVGLSYGLNDKMFLDVGLRAMYIPTIKWKLSGTVSATGSEVQREWFSADKMLYMNATIGLRVEF